MKTKPIDINSAESIGCHFDLDDEADAKEICALLARAKTDGANARYGRAPLKSEDFADEVAVDCQHIEAIMLLPSHSVRKLYLSEYARALKTTRSPCETVARTA